MIRLYSIDNEFLKEIDEHFDKIPIKFTGIVEYANGAKEWFHNGNLHRLEGPAYEGPLGYGAPKYWYLNGNLHRIDGPAIERIDGSKYWYIDNKEVTELQCKLLQDIMKLKGLL